MNGLINKRVLMLNQNYEPLTICSARRAIVLLFQGKVEMLAPADGLKLRTITEQYSLPSVVRLWHYKKVPMKRIMLTRKNVLLRDNNQCQYCGTTRGDMTVDHVIPKTMGGTDTWNNLVCSCSRCNNKKGNRTPEQAQMKLMKKPNRPSYITFIQRNLSIDEPWKPYLFLDSTLNGMTT